MGGKEYTADVEEVTRKPEREGAGLGERHSFGARSLEQSLLFLLDQPGFLHPTWIYLGAASHNVIPLAAVSF